MVEHALLDYMFTGSCQLRGARPPPDRSPCTAHQTSRSRTLDASWTAPTTNTDGTRLTDLASYRLYYGTSSSPCPGASVVSVASPTSSPAPNSTVSFRLTGLATGTVYFVAVSAVDTSGNPSA
jgi:hypothetical protein